MTLRQSTRVSISDERRQHFKKAEPPPYGFCYVEGKLEKDHKEHQILRIIHQQWLLKKSLAEIAHHLNGRNYRTRSGDRRSF